jgi:hypothetical protein
MDNRSQQGQGQTESILRDTRPNREARIGVRGGTSAPQPSTMPSSQGAVLINVEPGNAANPATADGVLITPGGIATTASGSQHKDDPSVVKGPWPNQEHRAEPDTSDQLQRLNLDWRTYSEWRRTKCPPPECRGAIWMDELDQAIHELIGEIGELATLLMSNGPFTLISDPESAKLRKAVKDEIGDVIFTASWVFDCIDPSFFGTRGRIAEAFLPAEARQALYQTHQDIVGLNLSPGLLNMFHKLNDDAQAVVQFWISQVESTLFTIFNNAAPISGRFKKLRWHRMGSPGGANPFYEQAQNLFNVMVGADAICTLTGMTMLSCVVANMAKLDQRFPDGWKAGGGVRKP